MDRRIIRLDYYFEHDEQGYEGRGIDVGETAESETKENENRMSAVCHGLEIDADEFVARHGEPWDWADADWERHGYNFEYCEEAE